MNVAHFGTTPSTICDAILAALSALLFQNGGQGGGGTGCVKSIGRVEDNKLEAIDRALVAGMPAILVYYDGGELIPSDTTGQKFNDPLNFHIFCCANSYRGKQYRFEGGDLDPSTAINPGVEELQDWALYLAARAVNALGGVHKVYPKKHTQAMQIDANKYIGTVELLATRRIDIYDDETQNILTTLGIIGNPLDPDDLWEADNITPKIADPATKQGGVITL